MGVISQCQEKSADDIVSRKEFRNGSDKLEEVDICSGSNVLVAKRAPKNLSRFEELEAVATEVTYRCDMYVDMISIQEEVEQDLINKCVHVNIVRHATSHKLPFLTDPTKNLMPNEKVATRINESQIESLSTKPDEMK